MTTRLAGTGLLVLGALVAAARSQEPAAAPAFEEWRLLEPAPDMLEYKAKLKEGTFDDASRTFLTKTALPQLAMPKNRALIDRIRRRMREVLCGDPGGEPKAVVAATQVAAEFMTALARDAQASTVARVNAALMVGELRGPDAKPWPAATAPLVALLGDESLPPAVRIAAAVGVARHVDADPAARAADVGPTLLAMATAPLAGVDPVAADWLRSRAFVMLARMGSAAPGGTAAAAAKVLADRARPVDVRVRAATALGRCIKAAGDTDVAAALAAIRDLAGGALAATRADIERQDLAVRLGTAAGAAPVPASPAPIGDDDGGPFQVYRRDAWRLETLANAIADGDAGLARVAGPSAAAANALAQSLRDHAVALEARPDVESLDAALAALGAPAAPAGGGGPVGER